MFNTYISQEVFRAINDVCGSRSINEVISESNKLYKGLKQDLNEVISEKEDIIVTRVVDRKIGKTYSLLKLACEFDIPIVVKGDMKGFYQRQAKQFFNKDIKIVSLMSSNMIAGTHFDVVLKDQGVKIKEVVDFFSPQKIRIVGINSIFDD